MYGRAVPCVLVASALVACSDAGVSHTFAPPLPGGPAAPSAAARAEAPASTRAARWALRRWTRAASAATRSTRSRPKPPIVYFIFDISGSMAEAVPGGTRYSVVQGAAAKLVEALRYVIKPGAAAFPLDPSGSDPCHPGGEIFPPTFGNPYGFDVATGSLSPYGGTPTAATLLALEPKLAASPGQGHRRPRHRRRAQLQSERDVRRRRVRGEHRGLRAGRHVLRDGDQLLRARAGRPGPINCVDRAASVAAVASLHAAGVKVSCRHPGQPGVRRRAHPDGVRRRRAASRRPRTTTTSKDLGTLSAVVSRPSPAARISCDITIADPAAHARARPTSTWTRRSSPPTRTTAGPGRHPTW